ncbi:hypothetical protein MP228_007237 [Amoeboaphelidium protococcarum]|nr:hypothetical protein MP228_007237 [Amoeboaphelidium protococcarum]
MENVLVAKINSLLQDNKKEPRNYVLLVDGSGSIARTDFNGPLKQSLTRLCQNLLASNKSAQIAVYQFSDHVQNQIGFTNNAPALVSAITNMRQIGHGTATLNGVMAAHELIKSQTRLSSLIIFTDGSPNENQEPYDYINTSMPGVDVLAVGIGCVVEQNLRAMTTSGELYLVQNFDALLLIMEQASQVVPEPPVSLMLTCGEDFKGSDFVKKMNLKVILSNKGDEELAGGFTLQFQECKYFESKTVLIPDTIPGDDSVEKDVKLIIRPGADTVDFPEMLKYTITYGPGGKWQGCATFITGFLRGEFFTDLKYNILPFGGKGQGKSSLMNSLATCLSKGNFVLDAFSEQNQSDHVTEKYSKLDMSDFINEPGCENLPFVFYDIWGTDHDNMEDMKNMFNNIIRGMVPVGTHRSKLTDVDMTARSPENHIHCLLIVIRLSAYLDEELMEQVAQISKKWAQLELIGPIVVVTGIDQTDDESAREESMREMLNRLPVQRDVFFVQNYSKQRTRNAKIDIQMRQILLAIRQNAERNMQIINKFFNVSPLRRQVQFQSNVPSAANGLNQYGNISNNYVNLRSPHHFSASNVTPTRQNALPISDSRSSLDSGVDCASSGLKQILVDLNIQDANSSLQDVEIVDFQGLSLQEIVAELELFDEFTAEERLKIAESIYTQLNAPEKDTQLKSSQWKDVIPPGLHKSCLGALEASGMTPENYNDVSQDEILSNLRDDLGFSKIQANAISRAILQYNAL